MNCKVENTKNANEVKLEKRLLSLYGVTYIITVIILCLIPLNSIKNVIAFILIIILEFICGAINFVALALNNRIS